MAVITMKRKLQLSVILDQLCFPLMIVVFTNHITLLGGSQLYLGSMMSMMSLISLIWNPIIGSLSDTYGQKLILRTSFSICALSHFLLVISNSFVVIFIGRTIVAFAGPILTILGTTASEVLTKDETIAYYNQLPTVMSVCFIAGAMSGGAISELPHGFTICFMLITLMNIMNIGIISTFPDVKKVDQRPKETLPLSKLFTKEINNVVSKLTNVNWKEYHDIFSVKLCFELGCCLFYRSIGPAYLEYGLKTSAMGYAFLMMSGCTIATNYAMGKLKQTTYLNDNYGTKRLYHAAIFFAIANLVLGFAGNVYTYSFGLIPLTVARTLSDGTFTEALIAKASNKDKGGVAGAFESINSFCGLVTPIGAGILSDLYGIKFTLQLALLPISTGLYLTHSQQ